MAKRSDTGSDAERRLALKLYLEGLGFRSIGRILAFSHVAVYQWIRAFGEQVSKQLKPKHPARVVEMDEMHSYIGHKKNLLLDSGDDGSLGTLYQVHSSRKTYTEQSGDLYG